MPTICDVECLLGGGQDLYHLALLHTGLIRLAEAGKIQLRFREPTRQERGWSHDGHTMLICHREGRSRRAAIDLYDRGNRWQEELLAHCDVYFKRSYSPQESSRRPEAAKIFPLGLNYAARPAEGPWKAGRAALLPWWKDVLRHPSDWRLRLDRARQYLASPLDRDFERPAQQTANLSILFQPRLWEHGSTDDNVDEINALRVDLVRLLKKTFGQRFAGGLLPTKLARERHAELLTTAPVERSAYVAFSLQHSIGINTRGLHQSIPFKMGEYLAGSFCVLSDPFVYELPEPLRAGVEYMSYRSAEECVGICENLLLRPRDIQELRLAAWSYYQSHVRAEQLWSRRLEEVWK